jgi:hypothetical protein
MGYVDDPEDPAPVKMPVGRPPKKARVEAAPQETADQQPAAQPHTRKFQKSWITFLPWLVFAFGVGVCPGMTVCPSSVDGQKCPGCRLCGRLMCELCMERNTRGLFKGGTSANPFVEGTTDFTSAGVKRHAELYHKQDLDDRQKNVREGFDKQFADMDAHLDCVFSNVYWLSKCSIALWKLASLCDLDRLKGYPIMRCYCNHVMARDMLMSIAHVIREEINAAACAGAALALMVDESTDVSMTGAMVLYLRLCVNGVFKTVFWGLVECADATANGLFKTILDFFKLQGVPTFLLFCFASDGASVMTV